MVVAGPHRAGLQLGRIRAGGGSQRLRGEILDRQVALKDVRDVVVRDVGGHDLHIRPLTPEDDRVSRGVRPRRRAGNLRRANRRNALQPRHRTRRPWGVEVRNGLGWAVGAGLEPNDGDE